MQAAYYFQVLTNCSSECSSLISLEIAGVVVHDSIIKWRYSRFVWCKSIAAKNYAGHNGLQMTEGCVLW